MLLCEAGPGPGSGAGADLLSLPVLSLVLTALLPGFVLTAFWGLRRGLAGLGATLMALSGPLLLGLMAGVLLRHAFAPAALGCRAWAC